MEVTILGAHNTASAKTGFTCVLIDDTIAVDAGSMVDRMTFAEQKELKAILLTHGHLDHIRDIPSVCMAKYLQQSTIDVYGSESVREALLTYLVNDAIYIDFTRRPVENPTLKLHTIEAGKKENIAGYEVLPVQVVHSKPSTGFQVTAPDGKKVFITSDTGPGLAEAWQQVKPDLLITEVTVANKSDDFAQKAGHLTPALLQKELESFKSIHNYLPKVILLHMSPFEEDQIRLELKDVEKALKIKITVTKEGMRLRV